MSHIVTIESRLKDSVAIAAACRRLGLAEPVEGKAKLFSGEAAGLLVQLPGWTYACVIDVHEGTVKFDDFEGNWGDRKHLVDDMGFGHPSTFGGPIAMPTLDRLASTGLRYNNLHVTALCSPTRAALLTGRNHHTCNTGAVQDIATAFEGNMGVRPASAAPLADQKSVMA